MNFLSCLLSTASWDGDKMLKIGLSLLLPKRHGILLGVEAERQHELPLNPYAHRRRLTLVKIYQWNRAYCPKRENTPFHVRLVDDREVKRSKPVARTVRHRGGSLRLGSAVFAARGWSYSHCISSASQSPPNQVRHLISLVDAWRVTCHGCEEGQRDSDSPRSASGPAKASLHRTIMHRRLTLGRLSTGASKSMCPLEL